MADARVVVGADASAVERAAAAAKLAWRDVGAAITSAIGSAASAVTNDLAQVALAMGKVSFSSQHSQVREFEAASARMAVATGRDLESVRSAAESTGIEIGKRPADVIAWQAEVGRLTYNFQGAEKAIKGFSAYAAMTGRSVDDYRGLAATLENVGHVSGDSSHALGVMAAQAEKLGVDGGPAAFADQIESMGDTLSHFALKGEADFTRITGAVAALDKGLDKLTARRAVAGALSSLTSDTLGWERYLGHKIIDKQGHVENPVETLKEIAGKIKHQYGSRSETMFRRQFGDEAGELMYRGDWKAAAAAAHMEPSAKPADAQAAINATDAGGRSIAEAELAKSARDLMGSSTLLGQAADKLQQWAANSPISSTLISTAVGGALGNFMGSFGKTLSTTMGGKGEGGAVGGLIDLATKGGGAPLAGGALSLLTKGISITGAAAFGVEAGMKFAEYAGWDSESQYNKAKVKDDKDASADWQTIQLKEVRDRVRAAKGAPALPGAYVPSEADTKLARATVTGSPEAKDALAKQLKAENVPVDIADKLAAAIADAMKGVTIKVDNNGSDTPVTATIKNSHSKAAGHQHG